MPQVTYNTPDGLISKEMASLGFAEVEDQTAYRIVCATTAPEKSGKTHWALTAPGPIACISNDTGTQEVAQKFLGSKKIMIAQFQSTKELVESGRHDEQKKEWKRQSDAFKRIIDNKKIRTMVWDTAGGGWDLCRLSEFGKLTQVMPHNYTVVNSEMEALIKLAYQRTDLNCIFIHKQKKQYKKGADGKDGWSGKWERAGFGDMPYLVQVNLLHSFDRETKEFAVEVLDSRINMPEVVGEKLEGALCTFEDLALILFPGTEGMGLWA